MLLAVRISSYGCTWEVWRALKKLELLSAAPRATLTLLSCSPNFTRASITRYTHAKHEPILKWSMGPLHDPVTWYKIIYTGEQVAQWDFQNNATRTSSPGPAFVLKVPVRNLLTSIYNFVPCDRIVQRAH